MADKHALGVTLSDIKITKPKVETRHDKSVNEIAAYRKDAIRSFVIGGISILLLLGLYFSGVIK